MKKFKTYFLAAFGIALSLLFCGKANAAMNNFQIVCDPNDASKTTPAKCYIIAQSPDSFYGVVGKVKLTDLELYKDGVHGIGDKVTGEWINNGAYSENNTAVKCENETGCVAFLSKGDDTARNIEPSDPNKVAVSGTTKESDFKGFTLIGSLDLVVAQDATSADCGKVCISFVGYQYKNSVGGTTEGSGQACREINKKITTTTSSSETGSFASYAVLAAGAFIAISAIAIAKKHNKLYKV